MLILFRVNDKAHVNIQIQKKTNQLSLHRPSHFIGRERISGYALELLSDEIT